MANEPPSSVPRADPSWLWRVPAYLPYVQPSLTDGAVAEAEKRWGVTLPSAYLELLAIQNGGYLRYELPDSTLEKLYGIGPRAPSIMTQHVSEEWGQVSFDLGGLVPLDGDGHWHICLDYRGGEAPCVSYVDIECDSQQTLASSFDDFLSKLRLVRPDHEFIILGTNVRKLKAAIEREVGHKFSRASARAHGYKRYSISEGNSGFSSIRMSENRCRRGFVPRGDFYYEDLKGELDEPAARLPGCPDSAIFASAVGAWRDALLGVIEELGAEATPVDEFEPDLSVGP